MKKNKDIFDLFKESEHKIQPTPSRHAWDKLESKLDARQNSHQTSWYRSVAMIAAVVALVAVGSVITLLNMDGQDSFAMEKSSAAVKGYAMQEKTPSAVLDGNANVAFHSTVDAQKVAINEGSSDKKLKPVANKSKSVNNKIQSYQNNELAGNIDVASNTYAMHEAPLEREMLIGQVTINDNTTTADIEEKVFGKMAPSALETTAKEIAASESEIYDADESVYMSVTAKTEETEEADDLSNIAWTQTSKPATAPAYEITEINLPKAEADVVVGEEHAHYDMQIGDVSPADRRLEEHIAESNSKVASKKKRKRDIFRKKEKTRASSIVPDTRSVGIASSSASKKERRKAAESADQSAHLFSWLIGSWKNEANTSIKKEWLQLDHNTMQFGENGKDSDYSMLFSPAAIVMVDEHNNRTYQMNNAIGEVSIFKSEEDENAYWIEIVRLNNNEFTLSTYRTVSEAQAGKQHLKKLEVETTLYKK